MESWSLSIKSKNELLAKSRGIKDNSKRILFILRNLGPQRFSNLIKYSSLSRSTVSKYLTLNTKKNRIEHRLITDKETGTQYSGYAITDSGIEDLGEKPLKIKEGFFIINELKTNLKKLEELIGFYKEIAIADAFIHHIIRIVSKIGDNFFELQQDKDLYLSLFYIFFNSILGQGLFARKYWKITSEEKFFGYKVGVDGFCSVYDIKKEAINYIARMKLITSDFGFYLLKDIERYEGDEIFYYDFFFHEEDLIGTTTLRLIKDTLIDEIIQMDIYDKNLYDIDLMAEEIAENLKSMGLIWEAIKKQFKLILTNLIVKTAIDMGLLESGREKLINGISQSKELPKSEQGLLLKERIIAGTNIDINLNILNEIGTLAEDILIKCPNKRCGKLVLPSREVCPHCNYKIRRL